MLEGFDKDIAGLELSDDIKATIQTAANKRAEGLMTKNTELLGKVSSFNKQQNQDQSSSEELSALKATIERDKLTAKGNYDEALRLHEEGSSKTIKELSSKVEVFEGEKRERTIDLAIGTQLKEVRINPLHQDAVTGYFKGKTNLVDGKAMVGEKSLSDAIKEWSDSDSGKASRLAPDNSGGDANGGTNVGGSGEKMTPKRLTTASKASGSKGTFRPSKTWLR